jgi:hypothetical protein
MLSSSKTVVFRMIPVLPSLDPARFQREPWRDVDAARGMARPPVRRPARQDRQWVSLRCGSVSIGFERTL